MRKLMFMIYYCTGVAFGADISDLRCWENVDKRLYKVFERVGMNKWEEVKI